MAVIVRPEFAATIAKGVRTGAIWNNVALNALTQFRSPKGTVFKIILPELT